MGGGPRSVLSGKHALAKIRSSDKDLQQAIQILHSVFSPSVYDASSQGEDQRQQAHPHNISHSTIIDTGTASKTVIIPRGPGRLPCHVLPNGEAQPWALLPMREAARRQYPDLLGQSCTFFHALDSAVTGKRPSQLVCCTKATFDLAKLMRNLGIIAGFELLQNSSANSRKGLELRRGKEPDSYADLQHHRGLKIRLDIRWDALKPLAAMPAAGQVSPLSTADGLPLGTRHLSRPSVPTLMKPEEIQTTLRSLPAGIIIAYHHELGLTTDAVLVHYDQPGLVLAHVALPWIQVAQIRAALKDKLVAEKGTPLDDTLPLTHWRLNTWLNSTLAARGQALEEQADDIAGQKQRIKQQVQALNQQDIAQGTEAMISGQTLQKQVQAYSLLNKLTAATGREPSLPQPSQRDERNERERGQQSRSGPPPWDQSPRHTTDRRAEGDRRSTADRPAHRLFGPPGSTAAKQPRAKEATDNRRPRKASTSQKEDRTDSQFIADAAVAAVKTPSERAKDQAVVGQESASIQRDSVAAAEPRPTPDVSIDTDPRELPGPVPESLLPPSVRSFQQRMNKKQDVEDDN